MKHDELFPYIVKSTDAEGNVKIYNFLSLEDAQHACVTSAEEEYGLVEPGIMLEVQKR